MSGLWAFKYTMPERNNICLSVGHPGGHIVVAGCIDNPEDTVRASLLVKHKG